MPKYEAQLDAVFKSLGDAGRRAMLIRLSRGEATLGQLAEPLAMSLPAVHQHLGVLESAGLVACEKRGRERWCRLETATMRLAEGWIADHRQLWEQRADALDRYLADPESSQAAPVRKQRRQRK